MTKDYEIYEPWRDWDPWVEKETEKRTKKE